MPTYPYQRREQLLSEILIQAESDLFNGRNRESNPLKRKTKASRLLNQLRPLKIKWMQEHPEKPKANAEAEKIAKDKAIREAKKKANVEPCDELKWDGLKHILKWIF